MPSSKEIRTKIKSVQNTRKITKAMEMVAASKMRKAQERMRAARPYGDKIRIIAAHLSQANPEYRHPYLVKHGEMKAAGMILVTTDKGLCGGLNTNVLRAATQKLRQLQQDNVETNLESGCHMDRRHGRDASKGCGRVALYTNGLCARYSPWKCRMARWY